MGYAQFVLITILNKSGTDIVFKQAVADWGKFYIEGEKDYEITPDDLNRKTIPAKSNYLIGACGRDSSPSGCQGSFELHTSDGITVARVEYMDPYNGVPYFTVDAPSSDKGWIASATGANIKVSPLGDVTLTIAHIG